ncbi:Glutathione S-transferase [Teratosphaeria destructans]|uniref:Glutathione S-transferase n=1 Tax=Teratosphaeria destructans TaxID=418781 RepID=A0A9W7SM35_9PEZI|nr:Glutathione S-transferase [Teratosphaeria destructans]
MVLTVYGYVPAWDLPDISPYVTKLVFFLKMTGTPFEYKSEDLAQLDTNAPFGKLPYIIDDDGTKVADSNGICDYLERKHGITLDADLSPQDKAVALAFERLLAEHLYWSGVIEPRWRRDEGWETYIPYIVSGAQVTPEMRKALDAFRDRIMQGFVGHGMGRRDSTTVLELYKKDVDALSAFLGDKKYFMGYRPHNIDAMVYAMLRHLVDQPQKWEGTGYVESKPNLVAYLEGMRKQYDPVSLALGLLPLAFLPAFYAYSPASKSTKLWTTFYLTLFSVRFLFSDTFKAVTSAIYEYAVENPLVTVLTLASIAAPLKYLQYKLRYSRLNALKWKYGFTDDPKTYENMTLEQAQEVEKNIAEWEFPRLFQFGWLSDFFRTSTDPGVSHAINASGHFINEDKRVEHQRMQATVYLIGALPAYPLKSKNSGLVISRINEHHHRYGIKINSDDILYLVIHFGVAPIPWINKFGYRKLEPFEVHAIWILWREIGVRMGVRYMPQTYEQACEWRKNFESIHRWIDPANHIMAMAMLSQVLYPVPRALRGLVAHVFASIVDWDKLDNLHPSAVTREVKCICIPSLFQDSLTRSQIVYDICRFAGWLIREFGLPRLSPYVRAPPEAKENGNMVFPHTPYDTMPYWQEASFWNLWGPRAIFNRFILGLPTPGPQFESQGVPLQRMGAEHPHPKTQSLIEQAVLENAAILEKAPYGYRPFIGFQAARLIGPVDGPEYGSEDNRYAPGTPTTPNDARRFTREYERRGTQTGKATNVHGVGNDGDEAEEATSPAANGANSQSCHQTYLNMSHPSISTNNRTTTSSQYAVADHDTENARLERQAEHLSAIMNGKLLHAPVAISHIKRALDVGCGTGLVTHYLGALIPDAEVIGLDVTPVVKTRVYPPNVQFLRGDVMEQSPSQWTPVMITAESDHAHAREVTLPDANAFDLVFTRLILDLIPHGTDLIAKSFSLLRPGGWSEHHELDIVWLDADDQVISDDWSWWRLVRDFGKACGLDFAVGSQAQVKMREVGFVDVGVKEYRWPFGGEWEDDRAWRGFGDYVAAEMVEVFEHSIEKAAEWAGGVSKEQVVVLQRQMRGDLRPEKGKHWKFWVTYGRKPG